MIQHSSHNKEENCTRYSNTSNPNKKSHIHRLSNPILAHHPQMAPINLPDKLKVLAITMVVRMDRT
uniref:Uncharacterized protein n=1 Tax=Arundo donax TaxID=35708 RepID=A0A0A9EPQ4_ARUDO